MGNLDAVRDWGYAPEYVEGMWRMLQARRAQTTTCSPPVRVHRSATSSFWPSSKSASTGRNTSGSTSVTFAPPKLIASSATHRRRSRD